MKKEYEQFYRGNSPTTSIYPLCGDSRNFDTVVDPLSANYEILPLNKVDCVVTSPPYCNSADYVEMYKLEHWFLDFVKSYDDFRALSHSTIRSHTTFSNSKTTWKHDVIEDICLQLKVSIKDQLCFKESFLPLLRRSGGALVAESEVWERLEKNFGSVYVCHDADELILATDLYRMANDPKAVFLLEIVGVPGVGKSKLIKELIGGLKPDLFKYTNEIEKVKDTFEFVDLEKMGKIH